MVKVRQDSSSQHGLLIETSHIKSPRNNLLPRVPIVMLLLINALYIKGPSFYFSREKLVCSWLAREDLRNNCDKLTYGFSKLNKSKCWYFTVIKLLVAQ